MKRILAVTLSLVITLMFCACQMTPENAVAVQNDSDRLIENAQKDAVDTNDSSADTNMDNRPAKGKSESLSEQYGIPQSYTFELQAEDCELNIQVDAQVIVPKQSAMPIYRVKATEFSQEMVSAFFEALCGDAEMWINSGQRTKKQIQELIDNIEERMEYIKDKPSHADEIPIAEEALARAQAELAAAPDTIVEERADGQLVEMAQTVQDTPKLAVEEGAEVKIVTTPATTTTYTGLNAYERDEEGLDGWGRTISVQNNNNPTIFYHDNRNSAAGINFGTSSSLLIQDDTDIDEQTMSEIGLAPSEAGQMVQKLLDDTGSGMVVDSVYLQDDEQKGNYDDIVRPAERFAYKIFCVRTVEGLPGSYVMGGSNPKNDMVGSYWSYENLSFMVNSEGIFQMMWHTPIEVIETVSEDAELKPFSEIQEIFEKMMYVKYEPYAQHSELNFEINRVTLSLHRIVEKDSNETGLLIPVWNFYGKLTESYEGNPFGAHEQLGESYVTINAIDGTVIDIQKGY